MLTLQDRYFRLFTARVDSPVGVTRLGPPPAPDELPVPYGWHGRQPPHVGGASPRRRHSRPSARTTGPRPRSTRRSWTPSRSRPGQRTGPSRRAATSSAGHPPTPGCRGAGSGRVRATGVARRSSASPPRPTSPSAARPVDSVMIRSVPTTPRLLLPRGTFDAYLLRARARASTTTSDPRSRLARPPRRGQRRRPPLRGGLTILELPAARQEPKQPQASPPPASRPDLLSPVGGLSEHATHDLAARGRGELVDEVHGPRHLVGREPFAAVHGLVRRRLPTAAARR